MIINFYRDMSPNPASSELIGAREGEVRAPYQLVRQTYQNNTFRGTTNFVTGVTHPQEKLAEHLELPDKEPIAVFDIAKNRHFSPTRTAKVLPKRCRDRPQCQ